MSGLTAADFMVREDGSPAKCFKAGPATEPMQIVRPRRRQPGGDDALQPLRDGLTAFVDKLQGHGEIGIVTVGERATSLVPSTTSTAAP